MSTIINIEAELENRKLYIDETDKSYLAEYDANVHMNIGLLEAVVALVPLLDDASYGLHYHNDVVLTDCEQVIEALIDGLPALKAALADLQELRAAIEKQ